MTKLSPVKYFSPHWIHGLHCQMPTLKLLTSLALEHLPEPFGHPRSDRPHFHQINEIHMVTAKPLFIGSIPIAASIVSIVYGQPVGCP